VLPAELGAVMAVVFDVLLVDVVVAVLGDMAVVTIVLFAVVEDPDVVADAVEIWPEM
jgi:hypothetical protein